MSGLTEPTRARAGTGLGVHIPVITPRPGTDIASAGLHICQAIVAQMGSEIKTESQLVRDRIRNPFTSLSSAQGKGTRFSFRVTLPVAQPVPPPELCDEPSAAAAAGVSMRHVCGNILVIEVRAA
jgi:hypothetical protein